MQKIAKIGFAAWCLWLVVELAVVITHLPGREASTFAWGATVGGIPMIAGGCVLTWALPRRPRRGLSIVLAILSALLFWKFYVSEIVFGLHPNLGGYTISQSVSAWLSRHTSGIGHFALWFPPIVLLAASFAFYPIYCITYDHAAY
jgi:hypothetical protein